MYYTPESTIRRIRKQLLAGGTFSGIARTNKVHQRVVKRVAAEEGISRTSVPVEKRIRVLAAVYTCPYRWPSMADVARISRTTPGAVRRAAGAGLLAIKRDGPRGPTHIRLTDAGVAEVLR